MTNYTVPIVTSHTGIKHVCNFERNLGDSVLKKIAKSKGLISVALFSDVMCTKTNLLQKVGKKKKNFFILHFFILHFFFYKFFTKKNKKKKS